MKAMVIDGAFGVDNLRFVERADPALGPSEVRVRMAAAALNYRDLLMVRGQYDPRQPLPLVPCSDGAGVIEEVGEGVEALAPGDRVVGCFLQGWSSPPVPRRKADLRRSLGGPLDGTLCERRVFPEHGVVKAPAHLDEVEAAALPCAYLTAWRALVTQGALQPGEVVVVQGTGGVSIAALQIGILLGARVIVTSSSDEKLERAERLGAWATINYRSTPEWGREVKRLTGGEGADHVVEVGGAGTLAQSLRAVRPGATVSIIGVLSGGTGEVGLFPVLMQNLRLQGVLVGSRAELEALGRALAAHEVRPVVDRVFPWEEARAAFAHLEAGRHFGKIALRMGPEPERHFRVPANPSSGSMSTSA
jgi:NADPH:quinone reductase-like Zn-dependent oxidoreductase